MKVFADRFITKVRELGHPLCVGIDPHLGRIPPLFGRGAMTPSAPETVDAVLHFSLAVLDQITGRVAIIKPQIALFEQLGWRGLRALEHVIAAARERDLLVLLDAKRGDIGSTAAAYASAYLNPASPMAVDAVTVNPYMGRDAIAPFVEEARATGRGVVVLVRNSNPGAADYQDLQVGERVLFEEVAASLRPMHDSLVGQETGWSSLAVTTAATRPEDSMRVRDLLPASLFLVLGYGAQGGAASDAVSGLRPGPSGLEGGIVNASRSVLFPATADTDDAVTWERAFRRNLDDVIKGLEQAVAVATSQ